MSLKLPALDLVEHEARVAVVWALEERAAPVKSTIASLLLVRGKAGYPGDGRSLEVERLIYRKLSRPRLSANGIP